MALPLIFASLLASKNCIANDENPFDNQNSYLPYAQIGGTRFFNINNSNWATSADLFIPIFQQPTNLVFLDARIYDRTGKPFEGNIHLGYRHLIPENQQLYGIYTALDRKHTGLGNYFNQLTVGGEFWWKSVFFGCNVYQPIGNTSKLTDVTEVTTLKQAANNLYNVWITDNERYEKAMGGGDLEVGYELINGLVGYVGGYYFKAKDVESIVGPRAKLTYDWFLNNGKRIGGIFDKLGLETGVQHDKPRGTVWYASANFRIGLLPNRNTNNQDFTRHMVDLIRRDVDVNSAESHQQKNQELGTLAIVNDNFQEVVAAIENNNGPKNIVIKSAYHSKYSLEITVTDNNGAPLKTLFIGNHLNMSSESGQVYQLDIPHANQEDGTTNLFSQLQQVLTEKYETDIRLPVSLENLKEDLS